MHATTKVHNRMDSFCWSGPLWGLFDVVREASKLDFFTAKEVARFSMSSCPARLLLFR
jgi:hypothetical protein